MVASESLSPATQRARTEPQRKRARKLGAFLVNRNWPFWTTLAAVLIFWEWIGRRTTSLVLIPPSRIAQRAGEMIAEGGILTDIRVSAVEFALGYSVAVITGVLLGIVMGNWRLIRRALDPMVAALYAMPIIALGPIFIISFGLGIASKVAIVALAAFFPMVMNTTAGARATQSDHVDVGRAFALDDVTILRKIVVPSSLPYIIAGLRLAVGRGLTAVLAGELFGARAGVGHRLMQSASVFDTAGVYVGVIIFAVSGLFLSGLLRQAEIRIAPWRELES